jgi:hypothetical protein
MQAEAVLTSAVVPSIVGAISALIAVRVQAMSSLNVEREKVRLQTLQDQKKELLDLMSRIDKISNGVGSSLLSKPVQISGARSALLEIQEAVNRADTYLDLFEKHQAWRALTRVKCMAHAALEDLGGNPQDRELLEAADDAIARYVTGVQALIQESLTRVHNKLQAR